MEGKTYLMDKNEIKIAQETFKELIKTLEINGTATLEMLDDTVSVILDTEDSGMVIGYHGDMLESLQTVASLMISKKLNRFVRVTIEVGDYKKNRTEWLQSLAQRSKEEAMSAKSEIELPSLKSWERRIVHLFLQDDPDVVSESIGEGKNRTLVIKPRVSETAA